MPYLLADNLHYSEVIKYKKEYISFTTLIGLNDGNMVKIGDEQYANQNLHYYILLLFVGSAMSYFYKDFINDLNIIHCFKRVYIIILRVTYLRQKG